MKNILITIIFLMLGICSFGQLSISSGSTKSKSQVFVLAVDTLILPISTKVKFIKVGDRVFELNIEPNLKPVDSPQIWLLPDDQPFKIDLHGGNLLPLGTATSTCTRCVPAQATKASPPPYFIPTKK